MLDQYWINTELTLNWRHYWLLINTQSTSCLTVSRESTHFADMPLIVDRYIWVGQDSAYWSNVPIRCWSICWSRVTECQSRCPLIIDKDVNQVLIEGWSRVSISTQLTFSENDPNTPVCSEVITNVRIKSLRFELVAGTTVFQCMYITPFK